MSSTPQAGARDQVARLLTLVPFLHSRGKVRLDEASRALGVPPEQVLADLKVLLMCGLPGGYPDDLIDVDLDALEEPEGDGVIRVTNADYLARPLRLTPTEATAIIVALRALRASAAAETREVVDRALSKLEAAAAHGTDAPSTAPAIDPGDSPGGELVRLETDLARAAAAGRQVRLHYFVPSRDEQSERVVDPRGIVRAHGFTYLDAWCHSAEAPRLFRLDRIERAEVLDTPTASEPAPPREVGPEGLFGRSPDTTVVTLDLAPAARWIVEYYPTEAVRPRRGGRLEVDLVVADERWLQRLLLRLAPHARVLAPDGIQERYVAAAGDTLRLYD